MNKRIKTRWIKALRSGKYKQGRGYLKYKDFSDTKYCCLGVLCEIIQKDKFCKERKLSYSVIKNDKYYFDGSMSGLSYIVQKYVDLQEYNIGIFINMNDTQNNSFKTISNFIEKNL